MASLADLGPRIVNWGSKCVSLLGEVVGGSNRTLMGVNALKLSLGETLLQMKFVLLSLCLLST